MRIFGSGVNALDFVTTNYTFSKSGCGDLILSIKDCVKEMTQNHNSNVDEAMVVCYQVFAKLTKPLLPECKFSDFYHP